MQADALNTSGRSTLTLRMWYSDIHNVPRRFCRYVCWSARLVPARGHARPRPAAEAPYSNYYTQTDTDEGYTMHTDIPTTDVSTLHTDIPTRCEYQAHQHTHHRCEHPAH